MATYFVFQFSLLFCFTSKFSFSKPFLLIIKMIDNQIPKKHIKKNQKKNEVPQFKSLNPFKAMQKHFKRYQNQQTDYSIVLQPQNYEQMLGYKIFHLPYPQGGILVRNFNNAQTVLNIACQALNVYCFKPYRTNLNSREELYQQKEQQPKRQQKVQEQIKEEANYAKIQAQEKSQANKGYTFNDRIRWANVGYQYDWTERKYPNVKTQIPPTIAALCVRANQLYNQIRKTAKNYYPESAIINYYSQKDYMTGHLDDAEVDQHSPIYSFSLGLSCIFLIGDATKDTKPVALRLNSGDLFIMSGKARQAYHGVPRVISETFNQQQTNFDWSKDWCNGPANVMQYLQHHRININVRQVYPTED